jgi:hypothetical protein
MASLTIWGEERSKLAAAMNCDESHLIEPAATASRASAHETHISRIKIHYTATLLVVAPHHFREKLCFCFTRIKEYEPRGVSQDVIAKGGPILLGPGAHFFSDLS